MKLLKNRKAASNIVATMLIFTMMVVSMALLYSRISPTVIGYSAETSANNQEFIFLNIETQVTRLATLPPSSVATVNVLSNGARYDVINGKNVTIGVGGANSTLYATPLGMFKAYLNKSYQDVSRSHYLADGLEENTMLMNDSSSNYVFGISRAEIKVGNATYWQYFRGKISFIQNNGIYTLNIIFYLIRSNAADFPLSLAQWVLKLRRGEPTITSTKIQANVNGITVNQTATHTDTSLETYNFGGIPAGTVVTVNFIEIPIYYEI